MKQLKSQRVVATVLLLFTCAVALFTIIAGVSSCQSFKDIVAIETSSETVSPDDTYAESTQDTTTYTVEVITEPATEQPTEPPTAIDILGEKEYYILAQLLWHEAGIMGWDGKVWVCSAILNLGEHSNMSIWSMAYNGNMFSVASYVDTGTPSAECFDVIEYVVSGGNRVEDVKYFRTDYYHDFGTPITKIENVYFSK